MKKHYSHGELNFFEFHGAIPADVTRIKSVKGKFIVANSETTGNHHCVKEKEGVLLFEREGVMYLKNDVETEIFCVIKERHDTIKLPAGVWEVVPSQEYDYLSEETRNVAD